MGTVKIYTTAEKVVQKTGHSIGSDIGRTIEEAVAMTQALIVEDIKNSMWSCPIHGEPDYQNDCIECTDCLEVNVIINNILACNTLT